MSHTTIKTVELDIPAREELARDGIPPEVMRHFREQARVLRAETVAAAFRRLRNVASFGPRRRTWPARASA
jgi:hypothetical protein